MKNQSSNSNNYIRIAPGSFSTISGGYSPIQSCKSIQQRVSPISHVSQPGPISCRSKNLDSVSPRPKSKNASTSNNIFTFPTECSPKILTDQDRNTKLAQSQQQQQYQPFHITRPKQQLTSKSSSNVEGLKGKENERISQNLNQIDKKPNSKERPYSLKNSQSSTNVFAQKKSIGTNIIAPPKPTLNRVNTQHGHNGFLPRSSSRSPRVSSTKAAAATITTTITTPTTAITPRKPGSTSGVASITTSNNYNDHLQIGDPFNLMFSPILKDTRQVSIASSRSPSPRSLLPKTEGNTQKAFEANRYNQKLANDLIENILDKDDIYLRTRDENKQLKEQLKKMKKEKDTLKSEVEALQQQLEETKSKGNTNDHLTAKDPSSAKRYNVVDWGFKTFSALVKTKSSPYFNSEDLYYVEEQLRMLMQNFSEEVIELRLDQSLKQLFAQPLKQLHEINRERIQQPFGPLPIFSSEISTPSIKSSSMISHAGTDSVQQSISCSLAQSSQQNQRNPSTTRSLNSSQSTAQLSQKPVSLSRQFSTSENISTSIPIQHSFFPHVNQTNISNQLTSPTSKQSMPFYKPYQSKQTEKDFTVFISQDIKSMPTKQQLSLKNQSHSSNEGNIKLSTYSPLKEEKEEDEEASSSLDCQQFNEPMTRQVEEEEEEKENEKDLKVERQLKFDREPIGQLKNTQEDYVIALFDFIAQKDKDISFKKNDRIQVIKRTKNGWWVGMVNHQIGYFPFNYVSEINS